MSSSRRSGRERKAVQLPNVGTPGGSLTFVKVNTISDQSSNDENDENDAEEDEAEDEDDDDDDVFAPKRAKNKGATKAKSEAKPKAVGGAKRGSGGGSKSKKASAAVSSQNFIFGTSKCPCQDKIQHPFPLLRPPPLPLDALESNSSATKLADTASQWAELFKTDKCVAVVKLVNSVLFSAGVQSDRGIPDTPNDCPDLDAYDAEEINDLLEERGAKETMEAHYPLIAKGPQNAFRKRFVLFFQALGAEMGGKKDKEAKKMEEELKSVVEPFMVLSSFQLASLRDAFSEATLVMASTLAKLAKATRDSLDTQRRLQKAEEDHMNKARPSDKHKALAKTLDLLTRKLSCCNKLIEEIFASVFVHRSKDVNDQVRVVCMAQLGELIMAYPQEYVSDAFLKYIGWQITDPSIQVRRECGSVLARIAADDEVADRLQDFVTRYREKMLHLASRDKDARVAKTYIALMHRLHDLGMLDEAETEELGEVDQVLFDPTATIDARAEALEFVMAHTEGFDDDEDDEPEEPAPKKGKKGDSAKVDESKALARRQKHAVQLETLSELTELHVKDPAQYDNAAKMLTQACLATGPGHVLLRDWSTMTALLLKESNDKITVSLSPALSAILLRMLVSSAESLSHLIEAAAAREEKSAGGKKDADKADLADWMRLGEVLQRDLAKLLKRFSDDHTNLAVLARLLTCCDLGEAPKLMRPLLKALEGIFDTATSSDAGLVSVVCTALRGWTRLGEQASGAVEPVVSSVLKSSWETLEQSLVDLQAIAAQPLMSTSKKSSSKKKGGSQSSQPQVADCVYALDVAMLKQVSLWRALDCRFLSPQTDTAALTDTIVEAMDFVVGLGENADTTPEVEAACASCAINAAELLFNVLLWLYRDAVKLVQDGLGKKTKSKAAMRKKKKKKQDDEDDEEEDAVVAMEVEEEDLLGEEDEQEYEAAVEAALDVRGKLVDSLLTWMQLGGDDGDDDAPPMHARLQRRAFQLVNDVRALMPSKARDSRYLDRAVFAPSQEVLAGLRRVFELEGKRAERAVSRIVDDEGEDEVGGSKGQGEAVQHLLLASLSSTIIFDVANLNRRQTAAILCRINDSDPRVVEVVKTLCSRLKQHAPHKYLEVQMVALKSVYTDAVAPFVAAHLRALEGEADEGFDQAENDAAVDAGRERLSHLAEKMGSNWGVTMLKEATSNLPNFFQVSIDFATEDPSQYAFIEVLAHFLRFVPKAKLASLTEHMLARIDEVAGLEEAMEASDGLGPAQLRIFLKDQLKSGKRGSNKKARLSMTSFTHKSDDSDDDEPFAKPSQRKKAAAKPKAAKRKALPMLKEKPKARPRAQAASKGRGKKRSVYEEEEEEEEEEGEEEEEEEQEQDREPAQQEQQDEEEEEEEPAPVVKAKSRAKAPAPKAPAPKAPAPKAPASKAPAPKKKASKAKRGSNFFDDDDEEDEEEEVMPQPAMRVVPAGSKPKMGLTLEDMSADEDEDEEEEQQQEDEEEEQPHVSVVAASPPKGSKRAHHDITASQNEALAALASIPVRRRY